MLAEAAGRRIASPDDRLVVFGFGDGEDVLDEVVAVLEGGDGAGCWRRIETVGAR